MLMARSSRFVSPSACASATPCSICRGERSMPRNALAGSSTAIGIRLPPSAHPSSSTRHAPGGAGSMPCSTPSAARWLGWVWCCDPLSYGTRSYDWRTTPSCAVTDPLKYTRRYNRQMAFTQAGQYLSISTPLGKDKLLLRNMRGEEMISGLFHFVLDMQSED